MDIFEIKKINTWRLIITWVTAWKQICQQLKLLSRHQKSTEILFMMNETYNYMMFRRNKLIQIGIIIWKVIIIFVIILYNPDLWLDCGPFQHYN